MTGEELALKYQEAVTRFEAVVAVNSERIPAEVQLALYTSVREINRTMGEMIQLFREETLELTRRVKNL